VFVTTSVHPATSTASAAFDEPLADNFSGRWANGSRMSLGQGATRTPRRYGQLELLPGEGDRSHSDRVRDVRDFGGKQADSRYAAIGSIKFHRIRHSVFGRFYRERFTERQFLADGSEMGRRRINR
jgi:hypothetical protein